MDGVALRTSVQASEHRAAKHNPSADAYPSDTRNRCCMYFLNSIQIMVVRQAAMPSLRPDDEHADDETYSESAHRELKKLKELNFRHYPVFPTRTHTSDTFLQIDEDVLSTYYLNNNDNALHNFYSKRRHEWAAHDVITNQYFNLIFNTGRVVPLRRNNRQHTC